MNKTYTLLLVVLLVAFSVGLVYPVAAAAKPETTPLLSISRYTTLFPNYAIATDTIHVMNGSVNSITAFFPTGTVLLNISGPDVSYSYQYASSPLEELVVFKSTFSAGSVFNLTYVYTGFVSSGKAVFPIQPGYSVASVNDSGTFSVGMPGWLGQVSMPNGTATLNLTEGVTVHFNGTTPPGTYRTASANSGIKSQAFISSLSREIVHVGSDYRISDAVIMVGASSSSTNFSMLLPSNVIADSITISNFFQNNVSSSLSSKVFQNYTVLYVQTLYSLSSGVALGLHISYSVPALSTTLGDIGIYGMYVKTLNVNLAGVMPHNNAWIPFSQGYTAHFNGVLPTSPVLDTVVSPVSSVALMNGASDVVLIIGAVFLVGAFGYTTLGEKREVKVAPGSAVLSLLESALSTIEATAETVRKYTQGSVRIGAVTSALATTLDLERKLVRELGELSNRNLIERESADRLVSSFKDARTTLSDIADLHTQLLQKKIRQSVYAEINSKYQRIYNRAIQNFRSILADLS